MPQEKLAAASPPDNQTLHRTQSTSFAAALVTSGLLDYVGAELNETGCEVVFIFQDPYAQGEQLHRRYDAGAFPRLEPKTLFAARGFLFEEMARLKGRGRYDRKK